MNKIFILFSLSFLFSCNNNSSSIADIEITVRNYQNQLVDKKITGSNTFMLYKDGKIQFEASSDAMIVKGIISLLVEVYSNATPEEILSFEPDYLKKIGITDHLSMNRTNGLASMIKQIKMYGVAYQALVAKGVQNADHP